MQHFIRDMICGTVSGVGNCLSGYIFDTVKVTMQLNPELNMQNAFKKVLSVNGYAQLFSGMYYPLVTVPIINAVIFSSYELYKKLRGKTELTFIDGIQNGAFAGLVNTIVVSPVELVKCHMQQDVSNSKFTSSSSCAKWIIKNQGIKGLFKGSFSTAFRQIFAYAAQFATYQLLKSKLITKQHPNLTFLQGMIVGMFAGISCWVFSYPQDIIKTILQVAEPHVYKRHNIIPDGGFFACGKQIYKQRGVKGFWIGIQPCLIRASIANAIGIALYQQSQYYMTGKAIQNY